MSHSSSQSHRCVFRIADSCKHPTERGDADDARCASCRHYAGAMRGLGDVVHAAAKATGVGLAADAIAKMRGKPCGCGERRAALNAAVPFPDKSVKDS